MVVPDVSAQEYYIVCRFNVKSIIVVPLFVNVENTVQIDINSHQINPFSEDYERFLEVINKGITIIY